MNKFFRLLLIFSLSLFSISAFAYDDGDEDREIITTTTGSADPTLNTDRVIPPTFEGVPQRSADTNQPAETEVSDTCDITDTDASQCAICNCYMHTVDMLSSTAGQGYPGGVDALLSNVKLLAKTIQVPQARIGHPDFRGNMCEVVYQPRQFSQIAYPNSHYMRPGAQPKGPSPQFVEYFEGEQYKRRMKIQEIINACQAAYQYAQENENPGNLFWIDSYAFHRKELPIWIRGNCRPTEDYRTREGRAAPILTMSCPRIENKGRATGGGGDVRTFNLDN